MHIEATSDSQRLGMEVAKEASKVPVDQVPADVRPWWRSVSEAEATACDAKHIHAYWSCGASTSVGDLHKSLRGRYELYLRNASRKQTTKDLALLFNEFDKREKEESVISAALIARGLEIVAAVYVFKVSPRSIIIVSSDPVPSP